MGQGGKIVLINNTPYDWKRTRSKVYRMDGWGFPEVIPSRGVTRAYVEFDENIFHKKSNDDGIVTYDLNDGKGSYIEIHLHDGSKRLVTLRSSANPRSFDVAWRHDGLMPFGVSGEVGNYCFFGEDASSWMTNNSRIRGSKLHEITMLGSHDAGMSELGATAGGASKNNTVTQTRNIGGQLMCGARYFDLRPVISAGKFLCGHYSGSGVAAGGNGQSFESIINQVNDFTKDKRELVILNISHDLNTDVGYGKYRAFNEEEWNRLLHQLLSIRDLSTCGKDLLNPNLDRRKSIGEVTAEKSAVIVRLEGNLACKAYERLAEEDRQKFCLAADMPIYDEYSDKNDFGAMASDQLDKLHKYGEDCNRLFLLSWTLTQSKSGAVLSTIDSRKSILNLAEKANMHLDEDLYNDMRTNKIYPNIIYMDKIETSEGYFAMQLANNLRGK